MAQTREATLDQPLWQLSSTAIGMVLVISFGIASLFFLLHQQRLDTMLARSVQLNDLLLSPTQQAPKNDAELIANLEQKAHTLLTIDDFLSLTLVDARGKKLFERGLPIHGKDIGLRYRTESSWQHDEQLHLSRPWYLMKGQNTWLITTIDKTSLSLLNLQYLFATSLIGLGVILFSILFWRKLNRDIFSPLTRLSDELFQKNRSREISPLALSNSGIFAPLLHQLNANITIQIEKEMELRKSVENAGAELRETLETVEVQNIDLDIARKNAVEMNRLKSEFLKKTSQDLRTPLSGILGFSELLQKTALTPEQKDYINTIDESTKGMLTIVSDIHDFSRLESGKLQVESKVVDLRHNIEETLQLQAPFSLEREIKLYSHIDQRIPTNVLSDPLRIQQVLSNLVSNAIKFEHASYVEIVAELQKQHASKIDINIYVNTDGELPEELSRWSTSPSASSHDPRFYSGARIGLSIAKGIAEHMQGKIHINEQAEHSGFRFALSLKLDGTAVSPNKIAAPGYQVHALVFTTGDRAYKELTSRLTELGINNRRANVFADILTQAKRLRDEALKHARYIPLAVIEAQTSLRALDKILLAQTVKNLRDELEIPTVVMSPMGQHENVQKILGDCDAFIAQHPLQTARLRRGLLDQLGIVSTNNEKGFSKTASANQMKILVVDDTPANTKVACALLESFNAEVEVAVDGKSAIDRCLSQCYDLVFMDIQLPDLDGFETTMRIRRDENSDRRTPIVALTAHDIREERSKLLLAGMDDFISKPLTEKSIGLVIDRWVISNKNKRINEKPKTTKHSTQNKKTVATIDKTTSSPVNIGESLELTKNDAQLAFDMIKMLIESIQQEQPLMEKASREGRYDELYELVHRLHGACCYCGVPELKAAVKCVDTQLKQTELCDANDLKKMYQKMKELVSWSSEHDLEVLFSLE
ncbi:response regulator [Agaribacterium sp. ZY112]|uniref:response regulator n=1 Tax=Agaribacterium sp. ZY112 TaxID=3233574 RepID=UPI003525AA48